MLVSVNDVAKQLKISNRAVQIKCKRQGLVKIGNQYQISQEIADRWASATETNQRNEHEHKGVISYAKRKRGSSFTSLIVLIVLLFFIAVLVAFYFQMNGQIIAQGETIIKQDTENKVYNKRLNDAFDVIRNQEQEISIKDQELKRLRYKDSIRYLKRW